MSLYVIGDLHLSLSVNKPMDVFGGGWSNYVERIKAGFSRLTADDVCVLCGDTSWGMTLEESLEDFRFISKLPGRKIVLKGNHDYWWETTTKINAFFQKNDITGIDILNNNCFNYKGVAICGTRGWLADDETDTAHNKKVMAREVVRLGLSLKAAGAAAEKLCFFHYPPRYKNTICSDIIAMMNAHGVKQCWYGHIHGQGHRFAVCGEVEGINYSMISADYINFTPQKIR